MILPHRYAREPMWVGSAIQCARQQQEQQICAGVGTVGPGRTVTGHGNFRVFYAVWRQEPTEVGEYFITALFNLLFGDIYFST